MPAVWPRRSQELLLAVLLAAEVADATYDAHTREYVLTLYYDGWSAAAIVRKLHPGKLMCAQTILNWAATFKETGMWEPLRQRTPRYLMPSAHWDYVLQSIQDDNTLYLREIALEVLIMTGVLYTEVQLSKTLALRGITRKLADVRAMERDPVARSNFAQVLNDWPLDTYVSIDESESSLEFSL